MALDLKRIRAPCFDVDGTIADTDDHLVAQLAGLFDKLPAVSGRRSSARPTPRTRATPKPSTKSRTTWSRACRRCCIGAQTTRRMKPHPEPLLHAAQKMGVAPQACLMIGDTTIDVRTGVAAGAQTVGVLCGFGTERELRAAGAGLILRTTSDLLAVLRPQEDALGRTASPQS